MAYNMDPSGGMMDNYGRRRPPMPPPGAAPGGPQMAAPDQGGPPQVPPPQGGPPQMAPGIGGGPPMPTTQPMGPPGGGPPQRMPGGPFMQGNDMAGMPPMGPPGPGGMPGAPEQWQKQLQQMMGGMGGGNKFQDMVGRPGGNMAWGGKYPDPGFFGGNMPGKSPWDTPPTPPGGMPPGHGLNPGEPGFNPTGGQVGTAGPSVQPAQGPGGQQPGVNPAALAAITPQLAQIMPPWAKQRGLSPQQYGEFVANNPDSPGAQKLRGMIGGESPTGGQMHAMPMEVLPPGVGTPSGGRQIGIPEANNPLMPKPAPGLKQAVDQVGLQGGMKKAIPPGIQAGTYPKKKAGRNYQNVAQAALAGAYPK